MTTASQPETRRDQSQPQRRKARVPATPTSVLAQAHMLHPHPQHMAHAPAPHPKATSDPAPATTQALPRPSQQPSASNLASQINLTSAGPSTLLPHPEHMAPNVTSVAEQRAHRAWQHTPGPPTEGAPGNRNTAVSEWEALRSCRKQKRCIWRNQS